MADKTVLDHLQISDGNWDKVQPAAKAEYRNGAVWITGELMIQLDEFIELSDVRLSAARTGDSFPKAYVEAFQLAKERLIRRAENKILVMAETIKKQRME